MNKEAIRQELAKIHTIEAAPYIDGFYYTGDHYLADTGEEIIKIKQSSLELRLKKRGVPRELVKDTVIEVEDKKTVAYSGPLAGRRKGLHASADGKKLLAMTSPTIIEGIKGECPTIRQYLWKLLGDGEHDQISRFMAWLQSGREAVIEGSSKPGHLLGLTGARGCGKSQLIALAEACMGGRQANPRDYFTGGRFNADLVGAELLVMDDEDVPQREAARQSFKQRVKNFLYSSAPRIEGKGKDAFTFRGTWRAVVACNQSEDDLRALPAIDSGTEDKLIYLVCNPAFPKKISDDEFLEWESKIKEEIPAFIWEVENFAIPEEMLGGRGKIQGWQHPKILEILSGLDGWRVLMELVDSCGAITLPWEGKARELESILTRDDSDTKRHAVKLLGTWHGKMGALLNDAMEATDRVEELPMHRGVRRYCISPHEDGEAPWEEEIPSDEDLPF